MYIGKRDRWYKIVKAGDYNRNRYLLDDSQRLHQKALTKTSGSTRKGI